MTVSLAYLYLLSHAVINIQVSDPVFMLPDAKSNTPVSNRLANKITTQIYKGIFPNTKILTFSSFVGGVGMMYTNGFINSGFGHIEKYLAVDECRSVTTNNMYFYHHLNARSMLTRFGGDQA